MQVELERARALLVEMGQPAQTWSASKVEARLNNWAKLVSGNEPTGENMVLFKSVVGALNADEEVNVVEEITVSDAKEPKGKAKAKAGKEKSTKAPAGKAAKADRGETRGDQIYKVLGKKPMKPKEIKEAAGIDAGTPIFSNMKKLMADGRVEQTEDGGYVRAAKAK